MDKDLELAVNNPTEYLLKPQTQTNWDMSIDDAARAISYNPREVLLTKAEAEPKSYGWAKTAIANLGRGVESMFAPETGAQALTELYQSPNMPKEKADRLIEDMAYSRYAGRMAQTMTRPKGEQLAEEKYPITSNISRGIGRFIAQTLTGMANKYAAISSIYSTSQQQMEEGLIGRYIEETGGIEGYANKKAKDDMLVGGFSALNTLIERGLGAERIIERAFQNPTRAGLKTAVEQIVNPSRIVSREALRQAGKQVAKSATGEFSEEFVQEYLGSATEVAAGYKTLAELFSDEQLISAGIAGAYGGIIGGIAGFGLHSANRIAIKNRVNKWAKENGIQLSDTQLTQIANELIDTTQDQIVDHVTTMSEIQNHYGQAYNLVKDRIRAQIDATGTTPWTDQNKSKEEYIQTLADSITIPAINVANMLNIPLSEFLEIADINTATVAGNVAWLQPITSVEDIDKIIAEQDIIIKEQREAKKLGVDNETTLSRARSRKAIAERVRKEIIGEQAIKTARQNRKKETADYVTAQDLQPEQLRTLENAVQATQEQEYVLFGGIRIPVQYQVVELATVQPSHIDGELNPNYTNTELQNRASRGTTQDVADLRQKAQNITPERLMRASTSAEGAPVVNEKGEVIAGNGRAEIIRYAYQNPETAEKYKQELVKQGFNIEGMQQPVLVRRNTTMTDQEQVAAADISNISETSAFDNASQARRDTQYLKDSKTPIEFASKLPMSERRGLMQNNGKWNKRKVQQRYEDALLSWLCGNDTQLFENLVLDRGLSQKVIDILTANGTLIYETATKYPTTELREDIYHALVKMQRTSRDNFIEVTQQLEIDGHDVMPENIMIWNWLFTDTTTNRQFLQSYATTLANNQETIRTGQDVLGQKIAPLSKKDALMQALKKADRAKAETYAARGKDYAPLFDENEKVTDPNLAAAIVSYNNQFAPVNTSNQLSQEVLQQFDLADENARLDDIYPAYDGETIEVDGKERTVYNSNGNRIAKSAEALTNFWKWFGDSKVVDEQGRPLVVYHGSTRKFVEFDISKSNKESNLGAGFYFTDNEEDVSSNYEGGGVDFDNRVNRLAEQIEQEEGIDYEEARIKAYEQEFAESTKYDVYLKMENPFVIGGENETVLTFEEKYNEETDEYEEPTGTLLDFAYALDNELADLGIDDYKVSSGLFERAAENGGEITASEINDLLDGDEQLSNMLLDYGNESVGQLLSDAVGIEYDGFIDHTVSKKFGSERKVGVAMAGVDSDTTHYVAFNPTQIKSVDNRGTFSEKTGNIYYQKGFASMRGELIGDALVNTLGQKTTIQDVINEIDSLIKSYEPDVISTKTIENEYQDKKTMGEVLKNRLLKKYSPDTLLRNVASFFTEPSLSNDTGKEMYDKIVRELVLSPEAFDKIKKDQSLGLTKNPIPREIASKLLRKYGIMGGRYYGKRDKHGFVTFDKTPMVERLFQKRGVVRGTYDPELQAIILTKYWNETTLVHEYHHRYLEKLWEYFKQAQTGERAVPEAFMADMDKLFQMLEIDPAQDQLTVVQQEKFATMVEAYLTGLGVDAPENLAFQSFLHWIPEQYKSIMDLGYLDENNEIQNPILDQESIDWFNKWFASPFAPSLPSAPDAQRIVNVTDDKGEIIPSSQKIMNNREKEWGQDSEEQNKADAQLWRAINENTPNDMRAALDGEKEIMKAETKNLPDDTKLPEEHKPTMREKWFKTRIPDARERAATMAREYLAKNPDHAKELAFADPETLADYDAPVDHGMLIRAVMETVPHGSDEWYILNDNLATVKSMSGSTLSLSGDTSHQAYLDAKREVEAARELKAAVNYAGTRRGAMDKWNSDIRAFIAKNTDSILATEPDSKERKVAIQAFLEEAKTKFSANTTNAVLNQMDLTGMKTKSSQAFVKWAEKQIKQAAHAKIDATEQKELIKASIAAQLALKEIDSTVAKDGKYTRAVQAAKDIRHWQFVKDKMKKAYIGRWGKFGIFWDNLFGSYAPSAMLMSVNTLFFANVPSTALNTGTIRLSANVIGKNNVDKDLQKGEISRIKQVFNASGVNLAQMDKPTSPSTLHGEKYTKAEQTRWYDFTFEILGRTDNEFRVPTFVDALARIATKNADGDKTKANVLFKEYAKLNNQSDEAKIARKQALAVANMAVFTQEGTLATGLNQIRTVLNTITRVPFGLEPQGFGLGNILAPFLKTGANITEMGISSMLAPIRTMAAGFQKLQGKEIPDIKKLALVSDWINLAWTSVMIALMAAISGDDDEWYEEPYQSGRRYDPNKPYDSIRFGNTWVKLDIFGPVAIPLRTAAMLIKDWQDKKLASIADGMYEALSDTPLVQQFTDSSLDYMSRQPGAYWSSFAYNQANKLVPAQAKTLTRATSRATGTTVNTEWLGKTINRKFHRNYGLDGERLTTNDLINVLTNRLKYTEQ